jgi:hypothetical protein
MRPAQVPNSRLLGEDRIVLPVRYLAYQPPPEARQVKAAEIDNFFGQELAQGPDTAADFHWESFLSSGKDRNGFAAVTVAILDL